MSIKHTIVSKIFKDIYRLSTVLPLYSSETEILNKIASKYGVERKMVYSIRNLVRIQREIIHPKITVTDESIIDRKIDDICKVIDNKYLLRKIIREINLPSKNVAQYLIIKLGNRKNLVKIINDFNAYEKSSSGRAKEFEINIEKQLDKNNIQYKNETELRSYGITDATPDILFNHPTKIHFNEKEYQLSWLDAKNYFFSDINFIQKSLKKQAEKYNNKYGHGCFVFAYGYDQELAEKFYSKYNTLIVNPTDIFFLEQQK